MPRTYTTVSGDMWDAVAYKAMGDEKHTDKLMKANLQYRDTVIFSAGVVLDIPDVEPTYSAALPPWKREIL